MEYNLQAIRKFGFWRDIGTMFQTVFAVLGKKNKEDDAPETEIEAADTQDVLPDDRDESPDDGEISENTNDLKDDTVSE